MKTTNKKEFSYYRLRLESYLKDYPPERLADEAKVKLVPIVPPTPAPTSLRADTSSDPGMDKPSCPSGSKAESLTARIRPACSTLVTYSFIRLPSIVDCARSTVFQGSVIPSMRADSARRRRARCAPRRSLPDPTIYVIYRPLKPRGTPERATVQGACALLHRCYGTSTNTTRLAGSL